MFLGFHDNFRLAVLINFVLLKKEKCTVTQEVPLERGQPYLQPARLHVKFI